MLGTIIVILLILWLLGFFGANIRSSIPKTGNWIHTLLVVAVILTVLNALGIIWNRASLKIEEAARWAASSYT